MFLSASACSVYRCAPMLLPTSTSALSIDRISNAVPASNPFSRTTREILSVDAHQCFSLHQRLHYRLTESRMLYQHPILFLEQHEKFYLGSQVHPYGSLSYQLLIQSLPRYVR